MLELTLQMLTLPGPKLVNQTANFVSKPKLVPVDNVELGKVSVRRKVNIGLTVNYYAYLSFLIIFII